MKLTHLGHACVLLESATAGLLIDPGCMSDVSSVAGIDAVLVTHRHRDHVDPQKLAQILSVSPSARLITPTDVGDPVAGLPGHETAAPGQRLAFAGTIVDVLGGRHATVHDRIPGCVNLAFDVEGGAFFHPGDSFTVPSGTVDVLAVAIDGPWLKIAESIDYVGRVAPRIAVPIHEGETTDPGKYVGMLDAVVGERVVRRLPLGEAVEIEARHVRA